MWDVEVRVGRLLRIRFAGVLRADEADAAIAAIRRDILGAGQRVVVCGDLRGLVVLSQDVSEKFVALFRGDNPLVARSAMLLGTERGASATIALQLERMVREGGNPERRTFTAPEALLPWLGEVLTPAERAAAESFLGR